MRDRQRLLEVLEIALVATQRREDHDILGRRDRRVGRLLEGQREHRVGADLDQRSVSVVEQRTDGLLEADRLALAAIPVHGVERCRVDPSARHRRVQRKLGRLRLDTGESVQQLVADRLDRRRVRGVVNPHPARRDIGVAATREQLLECAELPGHDDRGGAVQRSECQPIAVLLDHPLGLLGRDGQGDHAPDPGEPHQRAPAQRDDARRVLERQRTGDAGRRDLAMRVADHRRWLDPVRAP